MLWEKKESGKQRNRRNQMVNDWKDYFGGFDEPGLEEVVNWMDWV